MLEIKNLTKQFKKVDKKTKKVSYVGIEQVSFTVHPGRIFGLIGANGAGKTTTMRILAQLTFQQDGTVSYKDQLYDRSTRMKQYIGFVSGETQVYDRLTPHELLTLVGELQGIKKSEREKRIVELADQLDMHEFLHLPCEGFSTGMKQKVSIARALMGNPDILIFDEVTNGLDIFAAQAIKHHISDLRAAQRSIVYSTHIMQDADELCDDCAIIHQGKVLVTGSVADLHTEYDTTSMHDLFFKVVQLHDPSIADTDHTH